MTISIPPECCEDDLPDPSPMTEERLALIAKGLAHPARVRILSRFEECTPQIVQDIVGDCDLAQSTVSEHLRVLREAGILFARKDGPRVWYCMRRSVLNQYARAVEALAARREPVG